MRHLLTSCVVLTALLTGPLKTHAQTATSVQGEITLRAAGGVRPAVEQLIPDFETKTGLKVKAVFAPGGATKQQVIQGGAFDIAIVDAPYNDVIASGNVIPGSATPLASVSLVVVVRQGALKPDVSTPAAVKKMLLAAQSITYSDAATGAGIGVTVEEMLKTLGIQDELRPKIRHAGGMAEVAKGNVEIGITSLSQLGAPGVDVAGTLPEEIAPAIVFGGFVSTHTADPAAAKQFLKYLASADAAPAYKAHGINPATPQK